jgi:hypothetical protein
LELKNKQSLIADTGVRENRDQQADQTPAFSMKKAPY